MAKGKSEPVKMSTLSPEDREKALKKIWAEIHDMALEMIDAHEYVNELMGAIFEWDFKMQEIDLDEKSLKEAVWEALHEGVKADDIVTIIKRYSDESDRIRQMG